MNTIGIRVEASPKLYFELQRIQKMYSNKEGKKIALGKIVEDFTQRWIAQLYNIRHTAQNGNSELLKSVKPELDSINEKPYIQNSDERVLAHKKIELIAWEDRLRRWETQLRKQAFTLIDEDKIVSEKTKEALTIKEETLDLIETSNDKANLLRIEKEIKVSLLKELNEKKEIITDLKLENQKLKENVIQTLKRIEGQTEKNIFMDYIVPFLPVVAVVISTIIIQRNSPLNSESDSFIKEVRDIFNEQKPEDQSSLKKFIMDYLKKMKTSKKTKGD